MHCMCKEGPWTLFGSVCVARSVVCVAGRCLVGPESTCDLLTTGTSGECLDPCSIAPDRSFDERLTVASTEPAQENYQFFGQHKNLTEKTWRDLRTIKTESLRCSATRGTAPGPHNSRNSIMISGQALMHSSSMRMIGQSGNALKTSTKVVKDKVLMHCQANNRTGMPTRSADARNA